MSRKTWHNYREQQERNVALYNILKKDQEINAYLREEIKSCKARVQELDHYITKLKNDRIPDLLRLRNLFSGGQHEIQEGKKLLNELINHLQSSTPPNCLHVS